MRLLLTGIAVIGMITAFQHCAAVKTTSDPVSKKQDQQGSAISNTSGPPAIIYKTKKDYINQVAVLLNADKTQIIAYPHPKDLFYNGKLAKPTLLGNGYLLDNQGISAQVAFTSYTFEQYTKLDNPPPLEELMAKLIDKDPLLMLCNCGNRYQYGELEKELKELVRQDLKPCKKIISPNLPE